VRRGTHAAGDGSFGRSASAAAGRGVVLLAAAVVLGIVLLNRVDTAPPVGKQTATVANPTTTAAPTTTTPPARDPKDVKVLPVNGTKVAGAGARIHDKIAAGGYNVQAPDQAAKDTNLATTIVWYTGDYQREGVILAHLLGLPDTAVQQLKDPARAPKIASLAPNIVVEVGNDLASQPAGTTTTTAAHTATTVAKATTTTAKATTTTVKH
jgi:hypothetical protein